MEKSGRSIIKNKLADEYSIFLNKNTFYIAVCAFNDEVLMSKNFTEAIKRLMEEPTSLDIFSEFIINYFEPRAKK